MLPHPRVAIAAALLTLAAACGGSAGTSGGTTAAPAAAAKDESPVVARSGELVVTQNEFDAEMLSIPKRARERYETDKGRKSIVERILLNKKLLEEAQTRGVDKDPLVQLAARSAAEKAIVAALSQKMQEDAATEEAVQKYYEDNKQRYAREMIKAKHILVKEESVAKEVAAKLKAGGDFGELAKEYSADPGSKRRGGDLGWFTRERMVKPFADAAFALEKGTISDPVQSKFGWHVIQVDDKRDMQPLEEVRAGIERLLGSNAVKEFTDTARSDLDVQMVGTFAVSEEAEKAAKADEGTEGVEENENEDEGEGEDE